MASAGRTTATCAAAAAATTVGNRATFRGGKEDRHCPVGVLAMTAAAGNGFIGILHGTKCIKMMSAILTNILIKGHS